MAHIDDQRLMELALGALPRTAQDEEHLQECARCRDALTAEADLSAMLGTVPQEAAPAFLADRIDAAYVAGMRERADAVSAPWRLQRESRAPLIALAVTLVLLLPLAALLLARWTGLVTDIWSIAVVTRVLTSLALAHGSAPLLLALQAAALFGGGAILMRLLRTTSLVAEATS